jgi:hypothetical protein
MTDLNQLKVQLDSLDSESKAYELLAGAKLVNRELVRLAELFGIKFTMHETKELMIRSIISHTVSQRAYGKNLKLALDNRFHQWK